ncbi:sex peptide receptor-like [Narcine bancroftii]|uniref:sex peptide receptor-like n=1 Tax=Narcine bancroftii TaxID=1343680 RepID=UPI00383113A8
MYILSTGKCGLSRCITRYLMSMSAADLMVLIFEAILYEIKEAYFPHSFLNYTPICSLNLALLYFSIDCSVWLTVAFTFDRFVAICHQTLRARYCTPKIALVVMTVICSLSILQNIPVYFIYEARELIDNVPWSCFVKSSFYTSSFWTGYLWFETILTPFAPFLLIILFNTLTINHIILANRVRSQLQAKNREKNPNDQEIENRRKSIILLVALSGNFLLLWSVIFACFICVQFIDTQFLETNYNGPFTIAERFGYMLRCLSTCTNTFIYAVSQRHFRDEIKNMVRRPFARLFNKL